MEWKVQIMKKIDLTSGTPAKSMDYRNINEKALNAFLRKLII